MSLGHCLGVGDPEDAVLDVVHLIVIGDGVAPLTGIACAEGVVAGATEFEGADR